MKDKITDLYEYIENKYKGAILTHKNEIQLDTFLQTDLGISKNNCSLAAITRVLKYHFYQIDVDRIYYEIFEIAKQNMFMENLGTFPNKIDNIVKDYFKTHNIKGKCRGIYMPNFYTHIKRQIDKKQPVIMNIATGYYKAHSITVEGYYIFKYKGINIKILKILDSWSRESRYFDYTDYSASLKSIPIFSLNTIEIKR